MEVPAAELVEVPVVERAVELVAVPAVVLEEAREEEPAAGPAVELEEAQAVELVAVQEEAQEEVQEEVPVVERAAAPVAEEAENPGSA